MEPHGETRPNFKVMADDTDLVTGSYDQTDEGDNSLLTASEPQHSLIGGINLDNAVNQLSDIAANGQRIYSLLPIKSQSGGTPPQQNIAKPAPVAPTGSQPSTGLSTNTLLLIGAGVLALILVVMRIRK